MIKFHDKFIQKAHDIKSMLEDLINHIESLNSMEVGINIAKSDRAMDLVLVSTFDDLDALEAYRIHPAHQKVLDEIKKYAQFTKVVDYSR
jgi:hypothetical protein